MGAVVLFWLAMMGWLVRYEAFPGWFAHVLPGYRGVLPEGAIIVDSWMKILFQGESIGYSHTEVNTDEKNPARQYLVNNRTMLNLNVLGEIQSIYVQADAALDALYQLQRFEFELSSGRYSAKVTGVRAGPRVFAVQVASGGSVRNSRVEVPDETVLYSPFVEMSLSKLRPGQYLKVRTLDPATLTPAEMRVRAVGRETITIQGRTVDATALVMEFQGLESKAWMDAHGQMLRQETPFGWVMENCSPEEAIRLTYKPGRIGGEMLKAVAVPCAGDLPDPRKCRELKVRMTGMPLQPGELETNRQHVESATGATVVVTIRASTEPSPETRAGDTNALRSYLESTPFIQATDRDIRQRAESITAGRHTPIEKAKAIEDWLYRKVKKVPTTSLPSAVDVLREMEGDCNEHTYLFVALARAVGLPAQIRVGLLYHEGAFYYHAWPAVYVGDWIEMDPTLGQTAVDATHISLLEGELSSQLRLLGMIGKLKIDVLEAR